MRSPRLQHESSGSNAALADLHVHAWVHTHACGHTLTTTPLHNHLCIHGALHFCHFAGSQIEQLTGVGWRPHGLGSSPNLYTYELCDLRRVNFNCLKYRLHKLRKQQSLSCMVVELERGLPQTRPVCRKPYPEVVTDGVERERTPLARPCQVFTSYLV